MRIPPCDCIMRSPVHNCVLLTEGRNMTIKPMYYFAMLLLCVVAVSFIESYPA